MTGVLEVMAAGALLTYADGQRNEKHRTQEEELVELYQRFFKQNLLDVSPSAPTAQGTNLPEGIDTHAATCIHLIEKYQKGRRGHVFGVAPMWKTFEGDIRTRAFEEMKQWLTTVSSASNPGLTDEVSKRLEYCRQIFLRKHLFASTNVPSFIGTTAQVSKELEKLLERVLGEQFGSRQTMQGFLDEGKELVNTTLRLLLFVACVPNSSLSLPVSQVPDIIRHADLIASANSNDSVILDWNSDFGKCMRFLLTTAYLSEVLSVGNAPEDEQQTAENLGIVVINEGETNRVEAIQTLGEDSNFSSPRGAKEIRQTLESVRVAWSQDVVESNCGLLECFCSSEHVKTRLAIIDTMMHLDRFIFFLATLRPYYELAGIFGDIAMCRLHPYLNHLLHELEDSIVHHRTSTADAMLMAKTHLQVLAKNVASASDAEIKWMQGLRHIDSIQLDTVYSKLIAACGKLRELSTNRHAFSLRDEADVRLENIKSAIDSPSFIARCALAPSEGLSQNGTQLSLPSSGRPLAIAPARKA